MSTTTDLDMAFADLRVSELFVWRRTHERGWTARAACDGRTHTVSADGDTFSDALAALVAKLRATRGENG